MQSDIALVVSSSDNTEDILRQVSPSIKRFWPDCPFPIYVGKNSARFVPRGFRPLYAAPSNWQTELRSQLSQLDTSHVLLLLDDFLLRKKVATAQILKVAEQAVRNKYAYVRLRALQRAMLPALLARGRGALSAALLERISPSVPYYSGLQPALWQRQYLLSCLGAASDIWSFEHLVHDDTPHYAVKSTLLPCTHVVERGRWSPDASALFTRAGLRFDPGSRPAWSKLVRMRVWFGRVKFSVFGYTGVRVRRLAARLRRSARGRPRGNQSSERPAKRGSVN